MPESAEPQSRTVDDHTPGASGQQLPPSAAAEVDRKHLQTAVTWGRIREDEFAELAQTYLHYQELAELFDAGPAPSPDPDLATWATTILQLESPDLLELLNLDLADEALLDRWGSSTTTEKNGSASVPQALAQLFATRLGSHAGLDYGHAGLNHTYGYLLSPVPTKHGRKRHRWTSQEVAHTLGIPGKWPLSQGSSPQQGMLAEVTAALESVAPLNRPDAWSSPATATATAHALAMKVLRELPANGESTNGTRWTARTRVLRRADLTAEQASKGDQLLLVYSLSVDAGPERYITAFPVSAAWYAELKDPDENPHLKYNASLGA
ncbi:MAG: hypothetical protein NTX58_15490 [Actinobacteria bacterium]|nr:hypothetical protein [Actinomycetota bacterium]